MSRRLRTAHSLQPTADVRNSRYARSKPGILNPESHDTICALATSPGTGSIAVIRISGRKTLAVLDHVFQGPKPSRQPSQTVRLGWMLDAERKPLDQVLLTVFRRPKSYTGDDMAEVSCHGGSVTANLALDVLRQYGCRVAEPGEFTRRAVLAGKLSLSQAEAILDLVNARTPAAHRDALARYSGRLSRFIADTKALMQERLAEVEYLLSIDEDRTEPVRGTQTGVDRIVRVLDRAIAAAGQNRYLHSGARVAIIGRPNVGKSSLFNRLLGVDRAIVNSRPGTTRDRVDASMTIGDVVVRLEDTAGITSRSASRLTRLAVEQTRSAVEQADLLMAVFDGSRPAQPADREVIVLAGTRPAICVINKTDLPQRLAPATLSIVPDTRGIGLPVAVSCHTGSGISRLRQLLGRRLRPSAGKGPAAGERALAVLRESRAALERSREAPNLETAALEIRAAIDMLAQVDAPVTGTDILERVFARFCVGK